MSRILNPLGSIVSVYALFGPLDGLLTHLISLDVALDVELVYIPMYYW